MDFKKLSGLLILACMLATMLPTIGAQSHANQDSLLATNAVHHIGEPTAGQQTQAGFMVRSNGTQLTDGSYDETHPSISALQGSLVAGYDGTPDGITYYPTFQTSNDNGNTWSDPIHYEDAAGAADPCIDSKPSAIYATNGPQPTANGTIWLIDFSNLDDPQACYWDYSSLSMDSFHDFHISCYTHEGPQGDPGTWNWGAVAFVGYNGYNGNIVGCPYLFYQYGTNGEGIIAWLTGSSDHCEHTAIDIDLKTNMSYACYDRDSGNGIHQLILRKDNFGQWDNGGSFYYHHFISAKTLGTPQNLSYPSVAAQNNLVLLVAQTDASGTNDIVCFRSSDGFSTYSTGYVAASDANEQFPQIKILNDTTFLCTYLKDGTLYYKKTADGITWTTEQRVADDQIQPVENKAASLCAGDDAAYAIWQDGRGSNLDIYFTNFIVCTNHPPNPPSDPSPADHAFAIYPRGVTLGWSGSDPDGDALTYDVYFGDTTTPPKVSTHQLALTYALPDLAWNTTYYWKIVAIDTHGAATASPLWSFTTLADRTPPNIQVMVPQDRFIYLNGKPLFRRPLVPVTLILGPVTIEVNVSDTLSGIRNVDYYLNGALQLNVSSAPLSSWRWTSPPHSIKMQNVQIVCFDKVGNRQTCTMSLRRFF